MTVNFREWVCSVEIRHYIDNDRNAIILNDFYDGEPIATASVNLPNVKMESDEVAIKNYSENEGILEVLVRAEVISEPVRHVQTGYVTVPICKLLLK